MEDTVELMPPSSEKKKWPVDEEDAVPWPVRPQSYWYCALFTMICCCFPCGLIALIFSYISGDHYDKKDYASSVKTARRTLLCIKLSVIFGIIGIILTFIYSLVALYREQNEATAQEQHLEEMFKAHDKALMDTLVNMINGGATPPSE